MHSRNYAIGRAFAAQVQALAMAQSVGWLDNPALPMRMGDGEEALFVIERGNKLIDQPGQNPERRVLRIVMGAVSLAATARANADLLHFAARDKLKSLPFRAALKAALVDVLQLREVEVEPEMAEAVTEGVVLMSAYEVEYFQSYPSFA